MQAQIPLSGNPGVIEECERLAFGPAVWRYGRTMRWLLWSVLLLPLAGLATVYTIAFRAQPVGLFHDDGIYAVTAKALAEGRGYRIISLPDQTPQTKYPILFPALLAGIWKLQPRFPENALWLKLVPLLCAVIWWLLSYRLVSSLTGGRATAMVISILTAASPWVLFLSVTLLSETLFAAIVTAALLLVRRIETGVASWLEWLGVALLSGAAFLTRTVGVALVLAVLLIGLRRAGLRKALVLLLLIGVVCGPLIFWQWPASQIQPHADTYYSRLNYQSWNVLFNFTAAQKMRIITTNLVGVLLAPAVLVGVRANDWGAFLALLLSAMAVTGFCRRLAREACSIELFVLLYAGLVILWAWPVTRFLAPLLPLLLLYVFEGAAFIGEHLGPRSRPHEWALVSLAMVLAASSGWMLVRSAATAQRDEVVPLPNLLPEDWHQVRPMLDWISENTPAGAVSVSNFDPSIYLYSGRTSIRGFIQDPYLLHYAAEDDAQPLGTVSEMEAAIARAHAQYLVSSANSSFRESQHLRRLIEGLVAAHPNRFHVVYQGAGPEYRIYRIDPESGALHQLRDQPNLFEIA